MIVNCSNCNKALNVPDEKVPEGKSISFNCPSCNAPMAVSGKKSTGGKASSLLDETQNIPVPASREVKSDSSLHNLINMVENELEFLGEGKFQALVADGANLDRIGPILKKMDYMITSVRNHEEGLQKLAVNTYDLIVLNEQFDGCDPYENPIHKYIEPMPMNKRRRIFFVLVGKNYKTMDEMSAFNRSVNLVMNEADFTNFELILKKSMNDLKMFYHVFDRISSESGQEFSI